MSGPVPMATGASSPIWPLPAVTRRRWTFGADRPRGRRHAGVDLYAPKGSIVLAPEGGVVIATQRFVWQDRHDALLFQTDSGPVILFGEVLPGSWVAIGANIGSRVERGQPIARVGVNPGGSSMLHYEMYTRGTRKNSRWYAGKTPPPNLLDPTRYLQAAKAIDGSNQDDVDQDDDDPNQGGISPTVAGIVAVGVFLLLTESGNG